MENKIRKIEEILEELWAHPDYLGGSVWTKEMVIGDIQEHYYWELKGDSEIKLSIEEGGFKFDSGLITDTEWEDISDTVFNYYENVEEYYGRAFNLDEFEEGGNFEDLDKRIRRDYKVNSLFKGGNLNAT